MKHKPCGLLCATESASNLIGAKPVFAVHHHPESDQPLIQRDRRILENGSHLDGELLRALLALPAFLCGKIIVLAMTALWANRAIRPAHPGDSFDADTFVAEVADCLLECLWGVHARSVCYFSWLVKYIIAQECLCY